MSFRNSLLTALSEKFTSDSLKKEKIITESQKTKGSKLQTIIGNQESKVTNKILDILKRQDKVIEEFIEL